jgi:hypothetical protein
VEVSPQVRAAAAELKAQYCYFVDTQQWDKLRSLYTPDARIVGYVWAPDETADSFISGLAAFAAGVTSHHRVHAPVLQARPESVIEGRPGPVVRGRWSLEDYVTWAPGTKPFRGVDDPDLSGFRGYGYYEEEYAATAGGLKVSFMRLARIRIDFLHGPRPADRHGGLAPATDWVV